MTAQPQTLDQAIERLNNHLRGQGMQFQHDKTESRFVKIVKHLDDDDGETYGKVLGYDNEEKALKAINAMQSSVDASILAQIRRENGHPNQLLEDAINGIAGAFDTAYREIRNANKAGIITDDQAKTLTETINDTNNAWTKENRSKAYDIIASLE